MGSEQIAQAKQFTILDEAGHLTEGDRPDEYGDALPNFECSAAIVTALLRKAGKLKPHATIEAEFMPIIMMSVKLSRLAGNIESRDSLIDMAGYARVVEIIQSQRTQPPEGETDGDEVIRSKVAKTY